MNIMPLTIQRGWLLSVAMLLLAAGILLLPDNHRSPELKCNTYLEQSGGDGQFLMKATFMFLLNGDGTGVFVNDGTITYKGSVHILRREAKVRIAPINATAAAWKLTEFKETASSSDTTPDEVYKRFFFDGSERSGRYITINKVGDHWLIGSIRTPAFLC